MSEDYEKTWEEFWKSIVMHDGALNLDQVKRELHDYSQLMRNASIVYDHVTGGVCSKVNTSPKVVKSLADERVKELCEEAIQDEREISEEDAGKEVMVKSLQFPDDKGRLSMVAKHPAFAALAAECVSLFKKEGGINYVEWRMMSADPSFGAFTVLMQREGAKTPAEKVGELRKALDHATSCPLTSKARSIMMDKPEAIDVCEGCREALILLKEVPKPR